MSLRTLSSRNPALRIVPRERRTVPRHSCLREITCQAVMAGKHENAPALLEDISTGGLRLDLRRRYEPGRVLAVTWWHPLDDAKRTVLAHVVYAHNEGGGNWAVGCELMNALSDEEVAALL